MKITCTHCDITSSNFYSFLYIFKALNVSVCDNWYVDSFSLNQKIYFNEIDFKGNIVNKNESSIFIGKVLYLLFYCYSKFLIRQNNKELICLRHKIYYFIFVN